MSDGGVPPNRARRSRLSTSAACWLGALSLAALSLGACDRRPDSGGRPAGQVRLAILSPGQTAGPSAPPATVWAPILADLQARTGLKVSSEVFASAGPLVEDLRERKADVAWLSSFAALQAVRVAGGEVFARIVDASGEAGHTSVLIARERGGASLAKVLQCHRKLTLGLADGLSAVDALAPEAYLFAPRGVDPATCFRRLGSAGGRLSSVAAVADGRLDVATDSARALREDRRRGLAEAGAVRVIWASPELPEDALVWRKALDPAVKETIRQFFLTYGQGPTAAAGRERAQLARLGLSGFRAADDNLLLPAREMEAAHAWILARRNGAPARVAAARATLNQVTAERIDFEARTRAPAAGQ